ncbi:vWA domain-containing protein [Hyphomicrobium sulfonivorans]|uniref:vWA domain-containing protein n=1 Tax=Hyphomicrobium sulfonivorans TaxID=121290 RepID=UPI0015700454|nr:VWA domain-containing protein [Hyphomicrobium sulfonivorans]MBI1650689.1 VWA domain-containing protein [Hyphomicrobium sulfonivorans]NSL71954.1 VWA domain-containing protein [Hyphomicrobium sulfonivorans]
MFLTFFHALKKAGLPVSLREYLALLEGLEAGVIDRQVEEFYYLSRACLVKDERNLDRFDRVFGTVFKGITSVTEGSEEITAEIPEEWLRLISELHLSEDDKKRIEELGGWEKIMETLKQRLEEQKERHSGGNKWIGTGGTSPYGAYGYNPAGVRIGQKESRHRRAIKVWDKREFRDLDDNVEIGTRNIKVALRRLRAFARTGASEELDLAGTIRGTAEKGFLDIRMLPQRHNAVKVLMFFDVGGSMDWHIKGIEELFSAARSEFKHLEYYYFHNCLYEEVWKDNRRRHTERISTLEVLNTYPPDYKVVFVGDASMSPYEISHAGGSVEHMNPEPGAVWLRRVSETWRHCVWLNPLPESQWRYTQSIAMIQRLMDGRMYPLTLEGLDRATGELMR